MTVATREREAAGAARGAAPMLFEPGEVKLEDAILQVWEGLQADGHAACPLCGGSLSTADGCAACGAELS